MQRRDGTVRDRAAMPPPSLVALASAPTFPAALGDAADLLPVEALPDAGWLLAPLPPRDAAVRSVIRTLQGRGLREIRPPSRVGLPVAGDEWAAVAAPAGGVRFDTVLVRWRLVDQLLVLAGPLGAGAWHRSPLALLAAFAHPRQRLVARLASDLGAVAELAHPLRPRLVALAAAEPEPVVLLSADLVAATLIDRAAAPAGDDASTPWEHPAVQRAIDLDLGSRGPAELRIVASGGAAERLADRVRPRLGLLPT